MAYSVSSSAMMSKYRLLISLLLIGLLMVVVSGDVAAQCPMCKMSAESNLREGGTAGRGLNAGILFMLSLPYLIIGSIGYAWWRNNRGIEGDLQ